MGRMSFWEAFCGQDGILGSHLRGNGEGIAKALDRQRSRNSIIDIYTSVLLSISIDKAFGGKAFCWHCQLFWQF